MSGDDEQSVPGGGWVPAFEGQRRPFERGHQVNRRHGVYVGDGELQERVDALLSALRKVAAGEGPQGRGALRWIEESDERALLALAVAEARCDQLREYLDGLPLLTPKGLPWPAEDLLQKWERIAAARRADLGLTPAARARLFADTGSAVVADAQVKALQDKGRQLRAVRERGEGS